MKSSPRGSWPPISDRLAEYLDTTFPEQSPRLGDSPEKVLWEGGKRELVRLILAAHRSQTSAHDAVTVEISHPE